MMISAYHLFFALISLNFFLTNTKAAYSSYRPSAPWLGWESWGACFDHCNEDTVLANAQIIRDSGLLDLGYNVMLVDDNWQKLHESGWLAREGAVDGPVGSSENLGCPLHDPGHYPRGMKELGISINELGFHYGLYMSGGEGSCIGGRKGFHGVASPSIPEIDGPCLTNWNVTIVKIDRCGSGTKAYIINMLKAFRTHLLEHVSIYNSRMMCMVDTPCRARGLISSNLSPEKRAEMLLRCRFHQPRKTPTYDDYCENTSDVHRISNDGVPSWESVLDRVGLMTMHDKISKPGFWADPDYLLFEMKPGFGPTEHRSQFHMWVILSAPLLIGSDLRITGEHAIPILKNKAAINVNQRYEDDAGGRQFFVENSGWGFVKPFHLSHLLAIVVVNTGYMIDKTGRPDINKSSGVLKHQPNLKQLQQYLPSWENQGCARLDLIDNTTIGWRVGDDESNHGTEPRGSIFTVVGEAFPVFFIEPRSSAFYTIAPTPCPEAATNAPT